MAIELKRQNEVENIYQCGDCLAFIKTPRHGGVPECDCGPTCQHQEHEDCMTCVECGECREDLDSNDICPACGGTDDNETPAPQRFKIVCSECGSDDVLVDAYAAWDVKHQRFDLASVFDKGHYCNNCDGECRVEKTEVEFGDDFFVCPCGNRADMSGFFPCSPDGTEDYEPDDPRWKGHFVCKSCGHVYFNKQVTAEEITLELAAFLREVD